MSLLRWLAPEKEAEMNHRIWIVYWLVWIDALVFEFAILLGGAMPLSTITLVLNAILATCALGFLGLSIQARMQNIADRRRHTYATNECFEDAIAVAVDMILEEQARAEWRQTRMTQLTRILGMGREGPLAYDGDQPAQRPPRPDARPRR